MKKKSVLLLLHLYHDYTTPFIKLTGFSNSFCWRIYHDIYLEQRQQQRTEMIEMMINTKIKLSIRYFKTKFYL